MQLSALCRFSGNKRQSRLLLIIRYRIETCSGSVEIRRKAAAAMRKLVAHASGRVKWPEPITPGYPSRLGKESVGFNMGALAPNGLGRRGPRLGPTAQRLTAAPWPTLSPEMAGDILPSFAELGQGANPINPPHPYLGPLVHRFWLDPASRTPALTGE
jgi:hypothetical protein